MADLQAHLEATSRTFALAIPFLPEPTREEVTLAYLLLRIGDTLEDADGWAATRKVEEIWAFHRLLANREDHPAAAAFTERIRRAPPGTTDACLALLADTPGILGALHRQRPGAAEVITRFVQQTLEGMAATVRSADHGPLELHSLEALRAYCYIVAGLVGELLTELFILHSQGLEAVAPVLRRHARGFGEGLQLTNILKDESDDRAAGRRYIPAGLERAALFQLARTDLEEAKTYVQALRRGGAPRGFLEFTALPIHLAVETLDEVERRGAGAKISRQRVFELLGALQDALDRDGPLFPAFP